VKVLLIGGAGYVGTLVLPFLKRRHTWRVFDLRPPTDASVEYFTGSVTDVAALRHAAQGMDAVLYMAMNIQRGDADEIEASCYDVNVKGVRLALRAAHDVGIGHAVYCSSMSVYDGPLEVRYFFDEHMPPDARDLYGFTKRLGEEACRNAWERDGVSVNALRLCYPMEHSAWNARALQESPTLATNAEDVAELFLAALEYRNGFQAFQTSGDFDNKILNMGKARRLLGWEPRARPA